MFFLLRVYITGRWKWERSHTKEYAVIYTRRCVRANFAWIFRGPSQATAARISLFTRHPHPLPLHPRHGTAPAQQRAARNRYNRSRYYTSPRSRALPPSLPSAAHTADFFPSPPLYPLMTVYTVETAGAQEMKRHATREWFTNSNIHTAERRMRCYTVRVTPRLPSRCITRGDVFH